MALSRQRPARPKLQPVALITGASSGIGAALAGVFAEHGHQLVITARRKEHLDDVASAITAAGHKPPQVIAADLGARGGPARLASALEKRGLEPAIVVNNAGFGLYGEAAALDLDEQLAMIELDCRALTDLSLRFVDSLARRRGGILNVASIAGFLTGKNMAVYFASKAYVVSLSEALHRELAPRGVKVSALCPGPVATSFFRRAGFGHGAFPSFMYQSADFVARSGYDGLMRGKPVIVPGFMNKVVVTLDRLWPGSMQARHGSAKAAARPPGQGPI
jgi:short-subunit dehydrogenase